MVMFVMLGPFWVSSGPFGPFWAFVGHFRAFLAHFVDFLPVRAILGQFGLFFGAQSAKSRKTVSATSRDTCATPARHLRDVPRRPATSRDISATLAKIDARDVPRRPVTPFFASPRRRRREKGGRRRQKCPRDVPRHLRDTCATSPRRLCVSSRDTVFVKFGIVLHSLRGFHQQFYFSCQKGARAARFPFWAPRFPLWAPWFSL